MNYKVQLSPISSLPKLHSHLGFEVKRTTIRWEDIRFFRSWLVYDSDLECSRSRGRWNWSVILGLVIAAAVSGSGWYGITLAARHLLR
jgi:hypothetical protein